MPEDTVETVDDIDDRSGVIVIPQEGEHHFSLDEVDRKKDFTAPFPFNSIEFCYWGIGIIRHKRFEIPVSPANTALLVNLDGNGLFTPAETDLSGKVNVPGRKKFGINKPVDGAFTHHKGVRISDAYMVWRLLLADKRGNDFIEMPDFCFRE